MKKKLILIASLCVLIALLAVAALRDPAGSDVEITRHQTPLFATLTSQPGRNPDHIYRLYSFQMPFEEAVQLQENELTREDGWSKPPRSFQSATFVRSATEEYVSIGAGRVVHEEEVSGELMPRRSPIGLVRKNVKPDPRGWIVLHTTRSISPARAWFSRMRRKILDQGRERSVSYSTIVPLPARDAKGRQKISDESYVYAYKDTEE